MKKKNRVVQIIIVVAVVGIAFAAGAYKLTSAGEDGSSDKPTFVVKKGPLTISINESGTIKARDQVIIKNQLEGMSTILWVVQEATNVKEGDLLVELDASEMEDDKIDQMTVVQNADTAFITAREALAVGENQAKADIDLAQLTVDFADLDLKKYTGEKGEYETEKAEALASIKLADEELKRASEKLSWSQKLAKGNYISSMELKTDELSHNRSKLNLELAENKLRLLDQFTHQRQLAQLDSDYKQAVMALERTERSSAASVIQLKAELLSAESKLARERTKLAKVEDQLKKATIIAPADGMVVYASSAKGSWRGNQEPLEEGQSVHERQELIYLPTTDSVKAVIKVHESSMQKVRHGLPVVVTVDALPGKSYVGQVEKIALMPDAQMMFMNPDLKVYATEVYLNGDSADLRTGMSCRAEVIVAHYEDVMFIPVQAVVRIGDQQTVYVKDGKNFKDRKVDIGMDNNRMVHVKSGVEVGEVVLLTPPLAPAEVVRRPAGVIEGLGKKADSVAPKAPGGAGGASRPGGAGAAGGMRSPGGGGGGQRRPGGGGQRPQGRRPGGAN
jgi:HlyD family secretion protein